MLCDLDELLKSYKTKYNRREDGGGGAFRLANQTGCQFD